MYKVSVIIPTYNRSHYLVGAIQSVLNQTCRSYELIVVDDGSTDDTQACVQQFGSAIRYIRQDNQGAAAARNAGIHHAVGEYLAFLDSDDEWLPDFLEKMLPFAAQHPSAAAYYSIARCMDSQGNNLPQLASERLVPPENLYRQILRANFLVPSTMIVRRSAIVTAGLFDPAFRAGEDRELWLRMLNQGFVFLGTGVCLARYRVHSQSLESDADTGRRMLKAVVEKHFGSDDGQPETWSEEKRLAYGGLYRYAAVATLTRQRDWQSCSLYARQALQIDPGLAADLDLFSELAMGTQPLGHRGTGEGFELQQNAAHIFRMLADLSASEGWTKRSPVRGRAYGYAFLALGLLAYGAGQQVPARSYLRSAVRHDLGLLRCPQVVSTYLKALLPVELVSFLRTCRNSRQHSVAAP